MHRVCFTLQVKPDRLDEYRRRHTPVWREMLEALRDAGWHDYSLFLRADGLLVGVVLTDDFAAAQAAMEATEVNARWQAEMSEFFDSGRPDHAMLVLPEVFNLDQQLSEQQLSEQQPSERQPSEQQPSERQPSEKQPSEEPTTRPAS